MPTVVMLLGATWRATMAPATLVRRSVRKPSSSGIALAIPVSALTMIIIPLPWGSPQRTIEESRGHLEHKAMEAVESGGFDASSS
jgi:hypothetical protein